MCKFFGIIMFVLLTVASYGQQMRIGLFRKMKTQRITLAYNDGDYRVFGDSTLVATIQLNEFVDISANPNGTVSLKKGTIFLGNFTAVRLIQTKPNTSLILTPKSPVAKLRKYKDDFIISKDVSGLKIINLVDMNHYLAGVIESEGGGGRDLEYYKVQAVMSRTYAIKYPHRHHEEGFDLCDNVHCQAYHSMLRFTAKIDTAVQQTKGLVMTDKEGNLLDSYFHANCGGQTSPSEYVWNKPIPNLFS
ncbi:MAG: SpoIID/LytB domain-containing protein, partial [Crocinitomicaceae bacterium]